MIQIFLMLFQMFSASAFAETQDVVLDYMKSCVSYQDTSGDSATRDPRHRYCVGSAMFIYGSTKDICEKSQRYAFSEVGSLCDDMSTSIQDENQSERANRLIRTKKIVSYMEKCVQVEEVQDGAQTSWQDQMRQCLGTLLLAHKREQDPRVMMLLMDARRFLVEFPILGEKAFSLD